MWKSGFNLISDGKWRTRQRRKVRQGAAASKEAPAKLLFFSADEGLEGFVYAGNNKDIRCVSKRANHFPLFIYHDRGICPGSQVAKNNKKEVRCGDSFPTERIYKKGCKEV
ncbi:hypothetical protein TNIN_484891 [Trichonephila inaurata madagascariensis]|uniref:Uncharacterized protein n=1 Tax=Trichonephila inaurata madagascariensis TaxID=2747483 RepID=A0A8X7BQF8_9ARAC|nr:hypothetical protein TNIN_484891 [Trichonephila inaurata madagascariensis]